MFKILNRLTKRIFSAIRCVKLGNVPSTCRIYKDMQIIGNQYIKWGGAIVNPHTVISA